MRFILFTGCFIFTVFLFMVACQKEPDQLVLDPPDRGEFMLTGENADIDAGEEVIGPITAINLLPSAPDSLHIVSTNAADSHWVALHYVDENFYKDTVHYRLQGTSVVDVGTYAFVNQIDLIDSVATGIVTLELDSDSTDVLQIAAGAVNSRMPVYMTGQGERAIIKRIGVTKDDVSQDFDIQPKFVQYIGATWVTHNPIHELRLTTTQENVEYNFSGGFIVPEKTLFYVTGLNGSNSDASIYVIIETR